MGNVRCLAASCLAACAIGGTVSSDAVLDGSWGGVHAGLTLTTTGGTITYDCAHGAIQAAVRRDPAGRFEVPGVHIREHGGPIRVDEVPDSVPARYVGQVTGDRMELRVFVGADTLGPFSLQRSVAPRLFRCL